MDNSTFLQLFLFFNIFLIGAFATVALQHAIAHFRPKPREPEKPHNPPAAQGGHLPPEVKERLLEESQTKFQHVLDRSASELSRDLEGTTSQLNKQLERLGTTVTSKEMLRYQQELDRLLKQAETTITEAQKDLTKHQDDLKAKMAEEIATEKQRLIQQLDTKLGDAVASFLIETMGHNVDLGAQNSYLISMLEEHKAELTGRVSDEN
jgi:hypothetical protein